jgi:hypothetical protein
MNKNQKAAIYRRIMKEVSESLKSKLNLNESKKDKYLDLIGKEIHIIHLKDEGPDYDDRFGQVEYVDDEGQLHGSWGGLAVIPEEDDFVVIN